MNIKAYEMTNSETCGVQTDKGIKFLQKNNKNADFGTILDLENEIELNEAGIAYLKDRIESLKKSNNMKMIMHLCELLVLGLGFGVFGGTSLGLILFMIVAMEGLGVYFEGFISSNLKKIKKLQRYIPFMEDEIQFLSNRLSTYKEVSEVKNITHDVENEKIDELAKLHELKRFLLNESMNTNLRIEDEIKQVLIKK